MTAGYVTSLESSAWLLIQAPQVSWCKLEFVVEDPKDFNPVSDTEDSASKATPPLNVMSLSVRTIVNHRENNREIVCVTARTWRDSQFFAC